MNKQSDINKKAWSQKTFEAWKNFLGEPADVAEDMINSPEYYLRRFLDDLGEVAGKKVVNLLGSNGKKAIPLAILGADVTVVDISKENRDYAMAVAKEARVELEYIVSDVLSLKVEEQKEKYDIAFLEGGILHYFDNLDQLAEILYNILSYGGKLVLNDFHPIRKIFSERDLFSNEFNPTETTGNYFETDLIYCDVPYKKFVSNRKKTFDKCCLRLWTLGEIVTSLGKAGFVIERLKEMPRFDQYKNIPGEFTIVAYKYKIKK